MFDPRVTKLAEVLVQYSTEVRPGDKVLLRGGAPSLPLIQAIYGEVIRAGGFPLPLMSPEGTKHMLFEYGNDEQLQFVHDPIKLIFETYDVFITVDASVNTMSMSNIPPAKVALNQGASREVFSTVLKRYEAGNLRWMETLYPTQAYAQDAQMSLTEYENLVFGACVPDLDDPVGYWKRVSKQQQRTVEWLTGKKVIDVEGPEVRLHMCVENRSFVNCDGKGNMPDGEIYTCPVEDSVEGHVKFSFPTVYGGRKMEGVELWIEQGRVVKAQAESGEAFLQEMLNMDEGARSIGEFAIGTNAGIQGATGNCLYDEKIGGSFHLALGASAPDAGGLIESALHWDLVSDLRTGGRICADGELFYENGELLI
jgi:aminopeptidase